MTEQESARLASPSPSHSSVDAALPKPDVPAEQELEYPPFKSVLVTMLGLFITIFLVALDRTIIGTAIPTITNEFNSLNDVGWYASAYLLTMCGFMLFFGRIYTFFDPKKVYLTTIVIFEVGSALCGAAPNSTAFIIGRAIAGLGSAGVFSGAIPIFVLILPLEKRPLWTGLFGMVFGIASVVGPLLGGAFTDNVNWRWCFYINLPFGAVTFVIIVFVLKINQPSQKNDTSTWKQKLNRLDPIGTSVFLPSIICLLLALQWGGVSYAWSSARIIALLVLFGISFIAFIGIQFWRKENATLPPHIVKNRSIAAGGCFSFIIGSSMMVIVYFIPIWFQAIKNVSAVKSGLMNIPFVLGLVLASIIAGALTKKIGYYTPWMYASAILMPIGAGLITTFTTTTNHPKWIGYQVIMGFGTGLGMQQAAVAAQTVLPRKDVATGASLMFFIQSLGGAICSSVANNLFDNKLAQGLSKIPGIHPEIVQRTGATELRKIVPQDVLPAVLEVYNKALVNAFYVALAITCLAIFAAVAMPFRSVKSSANSSAASRAKQQAKKSREKDVEAATTAVPVEAATIEETK